MKVDDVVLRRLAHWGARYGPRVFVEHSPRFIGLMFAAGLTRVRASVRQNIRRVMGPRQPWIETYDTARTFMNYAACLAEGMAMDRREGQRAQFSVEGREYLAKALASGRGLILLTAHVGPFEAAAQLFTRDFQVKLMVVMHREADAEARRFHDELRRRRGIIVTHVGEHPTDALPVLAHLQAGGVAAIQLDRVPEQSRELDAQLFGASWRLPAGPFRLAALCDVPLMTVFARRRGFYDYEVVLGEPVWLDKANLEHDVAQMAQKLAADVERAILRDPTQWFNFQAAKEP